MKPRPPCNRATKLFCPFPSPKMNKKYAVLVADAAGKRTTIHFGDTRYQHYRDVLGYYKSLDHYDKKRRQNYYARHGPSDDITSPKFWSHRILWPMN